MALQLLCATLTRRRDHQQQMRQQRQLRCTQPHHPQAQKQQQKPHHPQANQHIEQAQQRAQHQPSAEHQSLLV
jgi:hypothetical protein